MRSYPSYIPFILIGINWKLGVKVLILVLGLVLPSCGCYNREYSYYDYPELAGRYFGVYKVGTYHLYVNQDGSKRDSVYVADFEVARVEDPEVHCTVWEQRNFKLMSEYIFNGNGAIVKFENYNCCAGDFEVDGVLPFYVDYSDNSLTNYQGAPLNEYNSINLANEEIVDSVVGYNSIRFGAGFGIVMCVIPSTQDTFTLYKLHVQ